MLSEPPKKERSLGLLMQMSQAPCCLWPRCCVAILAGCLWPRGPYKETIVNHEDGSRKLVAEGNAMNALGITTSTIYSSLHNYGKHRINYPKLITTF